MYRSDHIVIAVPTKFWRYLLVQPEGWNTSSAPYRVQHTKIRWKTTSAFQGLHPCNINFLNLRNAITAVAAAAVFPVRCLCRRQPVRY